MQYVYSSTEHFMFPSQNTRKNVQVKLDLDLWQWPWPLIKSVVVWKGRPGTKTYVTVFEPTQYLSPVQNKWHFSEFTHFMIDCHGNAIRENCSRVPEWHQSEFDSVCCTDAKTAKTYLLSEKSHFWALAAELWQWFQNSINLYRQKLITESYPQMASHGLEAEGPFPSKIPELSNNSLNNLYAASNDKKSYSIPHSGTVKTWQLNHWPSLICKHIGQL